MTERPILFSAPMVRAILDGVKTQTRRVVKFPDRPMKYKYSESDWMIDGEPIGRSPYGKPGDRLWVRETFSEFDTLNGMVCWYKAESDDPDYWHNVTWRPSIHMPRRLSRITLEIVAVRVERLHDISEADAIAEGTAGGHGSIPGYGYSATPIEHYRHLWESLNGHGSWAANPWVWVIEFKRVTP